MGSAALLAAQRLNGGIDGDAVDLPRLIAALAGQDGQIDQEARVQALEERLASDTCRASYSVTEGSVVALAYPSENDAETSALLAKAQPDLAADPVDYGVAPDGTIEIQVSETLGHYADWLEYRSDRIRTLNGLRRNSPLIVGRRLKLDFSITGVDSFEAQRIAYHQARQLRYFRRHRIRGVVEHPIVGGDNLWILASHKYGIPLWLLRQYNPDVNVDTILSLGSLIYVPLVETLPEDLSCAVAQVRASTTRDDTSAAFATSDRFE